MSICHRTISISETTLSPLFSGKKKALKRKENRSTENGSHAGCEDGGLALLASGCCFLVINCNFHRTLFTPRAHTHTCKHTHAHNE